MSTPPSPVKVRQLFATPVILDDLESAESINAALAKRILDKRGEDPGLALSNRGGWQSNHDFARWCGDEGQAVVARAIELATAHAQRANGGPPVWSVEAWANISGPGAFNMPHVHGGTFWAAVYYVRADDADKASGGELILHDPRMPGLRMHSPGTRFRNMGPELKAQVQPRAGLMVLFPGWLSHSVEPWNGSGERISVAMNIRAGL